VCGLIEIKQGEIIKKERDIYDMKGLGGDVLNESGYAHHYTIINRDVLCCKHTTT
jgi:hypothetical protein